MSKCFLARILADRRRGGAARCGKPEGEASTIGSRSTSRVARNTDEKRFGQNFKDHTHTRESVLPGAHATNLELHHDKSCPALLVPLRRAALSESDPARSCSVTRFFFSRQSRAIGRLRAREGRASSSDRFVGGLYRRAVAGGHQLIRVAGIARSAIDEGTGRRYFCAVLFVTKRETNLVVPREESRET